MSEEKMRPFVARVVFIENGTTKTDYFECGEVSATLAGEESDQGTCVDLTDGFDRRRGRRVVWKLYRNAETITKFEVD